MRNNHEWPRDILIPLVARAVGPGHTVDLKNYDALILVEIVQVRIFYGKPGKDLKLRGGLGALSCRAHS